MRSSREAPMNSVLIDTNIWLDIILDRPGKDYAKGAVMACLEEQLEMRVCSTSLKDIFYLVNKKHGSEGAYRAIRLILELAKPTVVDELICHQALGYEVPDYEDGIITACALAERVDAVVTRDKDSFEGRSFAKYTPAEFVHALGYQEFAF